MSKLLKSNLAVWMSAATVATVVAAIIVSALAMSPSVDHHVLSTHPAVVSAVGAGVANDGIAQPAADTNCHVGHVCVVAILPGNETAGARFDEPQIFPNLAGYHPSGAAYLLFHPPRFPSQA